MRILFSGVPSAGHILPMLPLAVAARAAGHVTALVTGAELASLVTGNDPDGADVDRSRIRWVGFAPMAELLNCADLVVSAAGAGTVIS